eukprot:1160524-Pelagomonas_calceolata.AAC.6
MPDHMNNYESRCAFHVLVGRHSAVAFKRWYAYHLHMQTIHMYVNAYTKLANYNRPLVGQQKVAFERNFAQICQHLLLRCRSDGKEVLHHCHGSDSGAAHFLTQTLDMSDNSSQHGSACTFLAALLGDLEEHALKTVRGRRWH